MSWLTYALVEATQISGPACVCSTCCPSREIVLPITFTMPSVVAPCAAAIRIAAIVSAVSPDWLITITSVWSVITGSR